MVTLITALRIQDSKVNCLAMGPAENGKFEGWIVEERNRWEPLLSTEPAYDTKEEAVAAMESAVAEIRAADLLAEKEKLVDTLGDDAPVVAEIVRMAKEGPDGQRAE